MGNDRDENEIVSAMSRRGFLKTGSFAMGTIALGGLVAGCGNKTKIYEDTGVPDKWDASADIIIVGFGGAAAAATISATEAGQSAANMLILEAQETGGGSTAICGAGTWYGGGTPVQTAAGFSETTAEFTATTLATVGAGADPDLIDAFCNISSDVYKMMVAAGVKYEKYVPGYMSSPPNGSSLIFDNEKRLVLSGAIPKAVPHLHFAMAETDANGNAVGTRAAALWKALSATALATGVKVRYSTQVTRLIVNESGRVVGVAAAQTATDSSGMPQIVAGTEFYFKANKAVLLSNGGFIMNKAMVGQYIPYAINEFRGGNVMDQGTGIKMGQTIGADTRLLNNSEDYGPVYMSDPGLVKAIAVNPSGQRFASEDLGGAEMGKWIVNVYPKTWLIFDQKVKDTLVSPYLQFTQAATIAELATTIGAPLLQDTVNLYNSYVAAGADGQFQKDPTTLAPISTGPFYAVAWTINGVFTQTIGGLRINPKSQVLNTAGNPIPGLYAAGATTAHIHAQYYAAGGSTSGAFTFGRIAGQQMVTETPWGSKSASQSKA